MERDRTRSSTLLPTLLRLCCRASGAPASDELAHTVRAARGEEWEHAAAVLDAHRLLPLCCHSLGDELLSCAPREVAERMRTRFRETFVRNAVAMKALDQVLVELARDGIVPVALKGAVLANTVYEALGTRPMIDLDLRVHADELEAAARTFQRLGYQRTDELDAANFLGPDGTRIDVAHRFRIFEHVEPDGLFERVEPRHLASGPLLSLEPSAMLFHLVFHMNGHRRDVGHLLAWFVDVALLLRERAARVELARLERFVATDESWHWLLRTIRFVATELAVAVPAPLLPTVPGLEPLTLDEILRSRRVRLAGSSLARAACRVAWPSAFRASALPEAMRARAGDLFSTLADRARERRSHAAVAHWRRSSR